MIKQIRYLETDRIKYEGIDWIREEIDEQLKEFQVINVETLKNTIRFWYKKD